MDRLSRGNLGYRKWRPPPKTGLLAPRAKRTTPNALEEKLMRVLSEAGGRPVPTAELAKHLGLFTNEVGSPARWLVDQKYIVRSFRRIKIEFGGRPGHNRFAFWSLSEKGMAWLASLGDKESPADGDEQPETAEAVLSDG